MESPIANWIPASAGMTPARIFTRLASCKSFWDLLALKNMYLIISLLLNSLALFLTDKLVPGFEIKDFWTAMLLAIILGFLNTFIKPLLVLLTAPLTIITLGLFIFVVNAIVLGIAAYIVPGVTIEGPFMAIIAAIVLSFISTALSLLARDLKKK